MFSKANSHSLAFFMTVGLALISTAQASGLESGSAHRRAHRLLKRVAAPEPTDSDGTVGAAAGPPAGRDQVVPVTTTYAEGDILHLSPMVGYSTISPSSSPAPAASAPSSVITDPAMSTSSSAVQSLPSSLASASNSSSIISASSTKISSPAATSDTASATPEPSSTDTSIPTEVKLTMTHTAIVGAPANTSAASDTPVVFGAAALPTGARNVIIGIGASILGILIIWFIIRKTKFGKSRDRLNPEDWQPTMEQDNRDFDPSRIRRQSAASSFHSGGGARDDIFAVSDHGHGGRQSPTAYPERDFTAGASAPIGVYADLARGESPTQSVYEQQYVPTSNHQAGAYDYHTEGQRY